MDFYHATLGVRLEVATKIMVTIFWVNGVRSYESCLESISIQGHDSFCLLTIRVILKSVERDLEAVVRVRSRVIERLFKAARLYFLIFLQIPNH
jgi:hypothetical protein